MFTEYTGNRQFDLQLNRYLGPILDRPGMDRLTTSTLARIRSASQIAQFAGRMAARFDAEGDAAAAWRLYFLAAFYLPEHDQRKRHFIDAASRNFDASHTHLAMRRHTVPYKDGSMTAIHWQADPDDRARFPDAPSTLVMMNGFDGYAEEIMGFAEYFPCRPFDIITFDGPGQGHTALAGMPLDPRWEIPTTAVLDYFDLDGAAALGVSFGGYLVMRAAAHCPRISHVIAFDMMYRLLDGLTLPLPAPIRPLAASIVERARPAWLFDATMSVATHANADLAWKLQQARQLTGLDKPSDVLRALGAYTMEPLAGMIHQPCLVMAGDTDQYVPFERLGDVRRALRNAESLEVRTFRHAQDPDMAQHCQIGDLNRAFAIMGEWLSGRQPRSGA